MSRFNLMPHPTFSPTRCVTCQANKDDGGFVDLMVDSEAVNGYTEDGVAVPERPGEPKFGHLWLCASCASQVAALIGWTSPADVDRLRMEIETHVACIDALDAALERERSPEHKVVKVADLQRYLRTPAEPVAADR